VFMAHAAISTFGGVETASSYHAGQMFERDVAMAKAQDAQH
jgi:nitrogen fixation protein FixH